MPKSTVLGSLSGLIQSEINIYSELTGLGFDVFDENMVKVAGTGASNYIPGEKAQSNFTLVEHVKRVRSYMSLNSRDNQICPRCDFRESCPYLAEYAVPLFIDRRCIGVISAHCSDGGTYSRIIASSSRFRDIVQQLTNVIFSAARGKITAEERKIYSGALSSVIASCDSPVIMLRNRRVREMSDSASSLTEQMSETGSGIVPGVQASVLISRSSDDITLKTGDGSIEFPASYSSFSSDIQFCDRVEVICASRDQLPSKPVFQDSISQVSIDYLRGSTPSFTEFKHAAVSVYSSSRFIYLEGERGLGKETWVRALHNSSAHSGQELIILDCNSFFDLTFANNIFDETDGLLARKHITICLKEVSKLSPWLQRKLADSAQIMTANDIRLVATSTESAEELVRMNVLISRFRDMFYPAFLRVPPVRERPDDLSFYIDDCIEKYRILDNRKVRVTRKAMSMLKAYTWPGNFKQLENTMGFLIAGSTGGVISDSDVASVPEFSENSVDLNLRQNEKALIREALSKYTGPNGKLAAAQALGISRATLYRKMKEYSLD